LNALELEQAIIKRLQTVIDPETDVDMWRMRLVEDLRIREDGEVEYRFRPSSPLCPIAVMLAQAIRSAVAQVPGVRHQTIRVCDYVQADLLTRWLNESCE
jgi:metal-sulfur cluster biosynthetic enzyme